MKRINFLRLHLALLISEYGKNDLLITLSEILNISEEELNKLILETDNPSVIKEKNIVLREKTNSIDKLVNLYPQKSNQLRKLYSRFQNKEFLPEAKDVKRFLETQGQKEIKIKSRAEASQKVFKVLVELPTNELEVLLIEKFGSEYSSLGTISDHILSKTNE